LQGARLVLCQIEIAQLVALAIDPVARLPGSRSAALSRSNAARRAVWLSGYWPVSSPAISTRLSGCGVSSNSASKFVSRSTRSAIGQDPTNIWCLTPSVQRREINTSSESGTLGV